MTQQPSSLYPPIESTISPLDDLPEYREIIRVEKDLVEHLRGAAQSTDILAGMGDTSFLPGELLSNAKKSTKAKLDPLKRLKELSTEEVEEEEEDEEEEEEDEEAVGDEEDDAGGDYIVSHFDNGEGFEDNDEDGDEMASHMI